jgi:hypothetical protein
MYPRTILSALIGLGLTSFSSVEAGKLSARDAGDIFSLYAYGDGISGYPVVYMDGT